jgi:hypothetical protein
MRCRKTAGPKESGTGKPDARPRMATECAISTGDSVQSQTDNDRRFCFRVFQADLQRIQYH